VDSTTRSALPDLLSSGKTRVFTFAESFKSSKLIDFIHQNDASLASKQASKQSEALREWRTHGVSLGESPECIE
jgi:hypothetical protein